MIDPRRVTAPHKMYGLHDPKMSALKPPACDMTAMPRLSENSNLPIADPRSFEGTREAKVRPDVCVIPVAIPKIRSPKTSKSNLDVRPRTITETDKTIPPSMKLRSPILSVTNPTERNVATLEALKTRTRIPAQSAEYPIEVT